MDNSLITLTLQSKEIIDIPNIGSLLEQCPSVLIEDIRRIQDIHWDEANVLGHLAGDIAQQFGRSDVTELKVWAIPRRDDEVDPDKAASYGVLLGGVDLIRSLTFNLAFQNSQFTFRYHLLPKELPRDVKKFLLIIYPKLVAHFQSSPSSSSLTDDNDVSTAYEFNDTYGYFLDLHEITYGCNNILERAYLGPVQPSGAIADAILAQKPWIETMITPRKWQYFCQGMYFTAEVYQHIFRCAGLTVGGAKTVLQAVYAATVGKMALQLMNHIWQPANLPPIFHHLNTGVLTFLKTLEDPPTLRIYNQKNVSILTRFCSDVLAPQWDQLFADLQQAHPQLFATTYHHLQPISPPSDLPAGFTVEGSANFVWIQENITVDEEGDRYPGTLTAINLARFRPIIQQLDTASPLSSASRIVKSSLHGYGVIATQEFEPGALVLEFKGLIEYQPADKDKHPAVHYAVETLPLSPRQRVRARPRWLNCLDYGNEARWVNHSCDPNATLETLVDTDRRLHIVLIARKPIQADEEITFDYSGKTNDETSPASPRQYFPICRCALCRQLAREQQARKKSKKKSKRSRPEVSTATPVDLPQVNTQQVLSQKFYRARASFISTPVLDRLKQKFQLNEVSLSRFIVEDQITSKGHSHLPFHHPVEIDERNALFQKLEQHLSSLDTPPYLAILAAKLIHAGYRNFQHFASEMPPKWLELSLLDILHDESVCKYAEKHFSTIPTEFISNNDDVQGQTSWLRIQQLFASPGFQRLLALIPQRSDPYVPSELWTLSPEEGKRVSFHMNTDFRWMNPTQLYSAVHLTYENMISDGGEITFPLHAEQFLKDQVFNHILGEVGRQLGHQQFSVTGIKAVIGTSDTTDQPHSWVGDDDLTTLCVTIYGPLLNVSPEEPVEHRYPQATRFLFPSQENSLLQRLNNTPLDAVPQFCLCVNPHSTLCEEENCSLCAQRSLHDELKDLLASYNWPSFFQEESNLEDDEEVQAEPNQRLLRSCPSCLSLLMCSGEFDRVIPGSFSIQESLVFGYLPATPRRWQSKSSEPMRLTWQVYITLAGGLSSPAVHPAVHPVMGFYRIPILESVNPIILRLACLMACLLATAAPFQLSPFVDNLIMAQAYNDARFATEELVASWLQYLGANGMQPKHLIQIMKVRRLRVAGFEDEDVEAERAKRQRRSH